VIAGERRLRGTGRVVSVPGRPLRFCAPVPEPLIAWFEQPAPEYCELGVDVVGVDIEALARARTKDGATEGYATLEGRYRDRVLTVDSQRVPDVRTRGTPDRNYWHSARLPCPPPRGGWPTSRAEDIAQGPSFEDLDTRAVSAYSDAHPGIVESYALVQPSEHQVVLLVLTHGDVAEVERALRPAYGKRLCVSPAPYSAAELASASHAIEEAWSGSNPLGILWTGGGSVDALGRSGFTVNLVLVTPEAQALVARFPTGLIELNPWLRDV
jgi:hypothetical protein